MAELSSILESLAELAPLELAEEWDNVGLLVGRAGESVDRVLTCLTITPDVVDEAIETSADLIVSHHPILFRPRQEITFDSVEGAMLIRLIQANIAVYSPHTAYDSAKRGINAQLAETLGLNEVLPIRPVDEAISAGNSRLAGLGSGRIGTLSESMTLQEFTAFVAKKLPSEAGIQFVGDPERTISTAGVACGSAAEFQGDARRLGADVLLTGEARFHACLEARSNDIALVIAGHYATERPAVERLAELIGEACPGVTVEASESESDPLRLSRA